MHIIEMTEIKHFGDLAMTAWISFTAGEIHALLVKTALVKLP